MIRTLKDWFRLAWQAALATFGVIALLTVSIFFELHSLFAFLEPPKRYFIPFVAFSIGFFPQVIVLLERPSRPKWLRMFAYRSAGLVVTFLILFILDSRYVERVEVKENVFNGYVLGWEESPSSCGCFAGGSRRDCLMNLMRHKIRTQAEIENCWQGAKAIEHLLALFYFLFAGFFGNIFGVLMFADSGGRKSHDGPADDVEQRPVEIGQIAGHKAWPFEKPQLEKCKILFLAANPQGTHPLQLDEEIRAIDRKIRLGDYRDTLNLVSAWAVRPGDLLEALNRHRPHIVHFSGHGSPSAEIILKDEAAGRPKPVGKEALRSLFTALKDNVRLVVLNACTSKPQAEAIVEVVDCAVGMNRPIGDKAAIAFAAAFYGALSYGRSVQNAFEQGKVAIQLEGIPEEDVPELLVREEVDASRVTFLEDSR